MRTSFFTDASRRVVTAAIAALSFIVVFAAPLAAQRGAVDIASTPVSDFGQGVTSRGIAIKGVTLGMSWGEARNILDRANVPYIFQKGTAPVVYVPPQNSSFYFVLNPSSYDVIEMGIIGPSELPLENQYLFDAQRWRLTTARVQFFGSEGEFIINEEGESYNFPFQGFVLKYLSPGSFRFVMVDPTNKPLLSNQARVAPPPREELPPPQEFVAPPADRPIDPWLEKFADARAIFETKNYTGALAMFSDIAENAPDALLRVRGVYWMGESYYGMKDFRNAIRNFERVLKETDIETLREPATRMIAKSKNRSGG
ncbi:MAG: hypothetical protein IPP94_11205 [Ignavibacteria bacterium]|nr:hypothetical protein [Ignavibacteria bacterium]